MRHTPSHPARLALILLAALLFLSAGKTSAQTPTRVMVDPPLSSVQPGQSFTVKVMVENVSDLWAYDLKLSFPPSLLQVTAMRNGGFLDAGMLLGPTLDNEAGTAQLVNTQMSGSLPKSGSGMLVCTQLATPPVSGNGTLIRLSFTGVGVGRTDIALTKGELADSQGNNTDVVLGGARVDVSSQIEPTLTATPAVTRTQPPVVLTPTQTATTPAFPTLAPSPTRSTLPGPQDPYPGQEPTAVIPPFPTQPPAREPGSTQPPMMGETEPTAQFPTPMSGELENTPLSPVATGLPVSNVPLRNTDQASVWQAQPARGVDLPWIILSVELVVLLGLVIMLIRHRRS